MVYGLGWEYNYRAYKTLPDSVELFSCWLMVDGYPPYIAAVAFLVCSEFRGYSSPLFRMKQVNRGT
jgi:hypothetical protein